MKKILFTGLSVLVITVSLHAQNWSKLGGSNGLNIGLDGVSVCTDPLGNVYAAVYDDSEADTYVYKWDGTSWINLQQPGIQSFSDEIMAICSDLNGNIYTGGFFTNSDSSFENGGHTYVAKWDGTSWSQVGNSLTDFIASFCFDKQGNM